MLRRYQGKCSYLHTISTLILLLTFNKGQSLRRDRQQGLRNRWFLPRCVTHDSTCFLDVSIYWSTNVFAVFAGKDASRALGKTSTKAEDARPDWQDLDEKEKGTLNDWVTFFSKRYNIIGTVAGATNLE